MIESGHDFPLGDCVRQVLFLTLFTTLFSASALKAEVPSIQGVGAIYGRDDRELISNKSDKKIQELSKSIALIITVDHMDIGMFRTTINATNSQETLNMCVSERFVTAPAIPGCTGFLVGPNIMASAGHCFQTEDDCANKKIIFDVEAKKQSRKGYSVSSSTVYSCSRIISNSYDPSRPDLQDYALIELDRAPKRRVPLKLNLSKKIADNEKVFMIGHPFGMPLMLSPKGTVANNSNDLQFSAALDSFEGNSGSPVFNAKTFEVEGILVNGQQDLVQDPKIECYRNAVYDGSGAEGVFRASELAPFLK